MTLTEQELVRILGLEETLKLETLFRSQFIYIGPESAPIQAIKEQISPEAAKALVDYMSGDCLWVPAALYREERNSKIVAALEPGENETPMTMAELASKFKIKTRAIRLILQRHNESIKQ